MTQEEIYKLISNNMKYGAYVYNQLSTLSSQWDNNYKVEYLYDTIPNNSLLFMVPIYSSLNSKSYTCKLTIRYLKKTVANNDGTLKGVYQEKTYDVYVENPEGTLTKASRGDIVAHRLCIFRFINGDDDTVILINSPLYNSVSLSTLTVTNKAKFYQRPIVIDDVTGAEIPLASNTDLTALENRVAKLESKFTYGTVSAEEALVDADEGTIYIQIEEGY